MEFLRLAAKLAPILAVAYVLSYAPMCRWCFLPDSGYDRINHSGYPREPAHLPGYAFVEALIDDSPLRDPLLDWADFWDCGIYTGAASLNRYWGKVGQWWNGTDGDGKQSTAKSLFE